MKKLFVVLSLCLFTGLIQAQKMSKELAAMFKEMPASLTNNDLKALITPSNKIDPAYAMELSKAFDSNTQEMYFIGKYQAGKILHCFYANVSWYNKNNNDYVMQVACSSYDLKSGEMITAGLQNYLCMVGKDALKRESTIEVSKDLITFTLTSTDDSNKSTVEKTVYKMGGYLEFISRQ